MRDAPPKRYAVWAAPAVVLLLISGGLCEGLLIWWWGRAAPFLWPSWSPYPGVALGNGSYEAAVAVVSLLALPALLLPALWGLLRRRRWGGALALGWGAHAALSHAAALGMRSFAAPQALLLAPPLLLTGVAALYLRGRLKQPLSEPGGAATVALLTAPAWVLLGVAPEIWHLRWSGDFDYSLFRWATLATGGVVLAAAWVRGRWGRSAAVVPLLAGAGGALGVAGWALTRQASWDAGRAFGVGLQVVLVALAGLGPLAVALRSSRPMSARAEAEAGACRWIGLALLVLAGAGLAARGFGSTTRWPPGPVLSLPADALDSATPVLLASGHQHTCAARAGGTPLCWGDNEQGQLGRGTLTDEGVPQPVPGLGRVRDLSCGAQHCCAVGVGGGVWCWGANRKGQLGDGTTTTRPEPVRVAGLSGVASVAAADEHTFAVLKDGSVQAWGDNGLSLLGTGEDAPSLTRPQPLPGLQEVVALATSARQRCALDRSGAVHCWGLMHIGPQPDGTSAELRRTPALVQGLPPARSVAVGVGFACALDKAGTLRCWGARWCPRPLELALPVTPRSLAASSEVCMLDEGGEVWCVDGTRGAKPRRLAGMPQAVALTLGRGICVATATRAVSCSLVLPAR